jgi:hypothetical protein
MPSWGNKDNAANTPLWATYTINQTANTTNQSNLFDNTTNEYWKSHLADGSYRNANIAVGVFGVDANEIASQEAGSGHATHQGWVRRQVFQGGRAGRIQEEVLVAMSSFGNGTGSDAEDTVYKDAIITISSQPSTLQGPVANGSAQTAIFSVTAAVTTGNTAAPLTYQWQVNNNTGGSWVNIDAGTNVSTGQPGNMIKSGANTATLTLDPTATTANNYVFRCVVTATGTGATATSANGRIWIV